MSSKEIETVYKFELYKHVILTVDLPEEGLKSGDKGLLIDFYSNGAVGEVEFGGGVKPNFVTLNVKQLRPAD